MPSLYNFSELEILAFYLVLIRLSAFVVSWPVFGVGLVPAPVKVLFALILAFVVFPVVDWSAVQTELSSLQIVWLTIREIFIGLSLGFLARLFFYAVNMAGELISISMGLSSGQLFNPDLGGSTSALEQFQIGLATLFFLSINGHHMFLSGIVESFRIVPLSVEGLTLQGLGGMGGFAQEIINLGVKLSAPIMISILLMNFTMAVVGRAVPQINVLITSLPVNILVGFVVLIVALPLMLWQMHDLMELTTERLFQILKTY